MQGDPQRAFGTWHLAQDAPNCRSGAQESIRHQYRPSPLLEGFGRISLDTAAGKDRENVGEGDRGALQHHLLDLRPHGIDDACDRYRTSQEIIDVNDTQCLSDPTFIGAISRAHFDFSTRAYAVANLFSANYNAQTVDSLPKVSATAWAALSDVADTNFWSPYGHN